VWSGSTFGLKRSCASTNEAKCSLALFVLGGFHNKSLVDMWDNTTTSDGSLDQSVKFFISSDSQLEMSWCDSLHFKILRSVSCEFENFSCQVLEDRSAVNCGGGTNSGVGTYSALQESMNSTDWELFINNKNCLAKKFACERKHVHSSKINWTKRIFVMEKNNLLEDQIWKI
jgi:hypothetical protein